MIQDLRYALHRCARTPGFVATVTLLLALGIGANTALFTMANALLFQPRPGVHEADQLYFLSFDGVRGPLSDRLSYPEVATLRESGGVFQSISAYNDATFSVAGTGDPERVHGQRVTGDYFSALRTPAQLGRMFTADDDRPGSPLVIVVSDVLWRRRFSADPSVIGQPIVIDGRPATLVGVAPPHFNGADLGQHQRDVWVPLVASTS